ncbi:MAG: Gldg family protein, partial [Planctomycetia bacterium]|nr:Gldg family protein [Planctomycetia bacterium]
NTKEAWQLERQYDIKPRKVVFDTRGRVREEEIIMAIIFRCGPRTTVIGFLNRGLAVEYELVSAFVNVGERQRKTVGILRTDASLLGGVDATGRMVRRPWSITDELARQYNVVDVDPTQPIPIEKLDALLAVQPSSLGPGELANFAATVRSGMPTVLFEDPYPIFADFVPGTKQKRKSRDPAMMLKPKGEFGVVLALLGLEFNTDVLWKTYNPYPKLAGLSEEFVFIDANTIDYTKDSQDKSETKSDSGQSSKESTNETSGAILNKVRNQGKQPVRSSAPVSRQTPKLVSPFNPDDSSVKYLQHLLLPFCGSLNQDPRAETTMIPLVQTDAQGTTSSQEIAASGIRSHGKTRTDRAGIYTVAARVEGKIPAAFRTPELKDTSLNVAFVADLDLLTPGFFRLRELGTDVRSGVSFDFDNVTFVLNLIDHATGQESLIPVRSRRPHHRTLTRIENTTRQIHDRAAVDQIAYMKEFEAFRKKEEESLQKRVQELANKTGTGQPGKEESLELQSAIVASQQRLTQLLEEKQSQFDRKVAQSQREVDEFVRAVQGRYKMFAILLPPIVPLSIGIVVYIARRRRQRRFRR